ncbi:MULTISPECIES: hypothetical protein [Paenibacillus]|uniref:hypothetical protein n=1 Tax=Paenibacillus TaxID=44249 RepID=UPI0004140700|nr:MULTISPECIES: hypothetical protein [Paenibacillus]UMY53499.1 hypothetical protein MLD56_18225 [Paenibacillus peoriae]
MDIIEVKMLEKTLADKSINVSQKQLYFFGSVTTTILSTDIFPKNLDLKEYIKIFEEGAFKKNEFKDYLYFSRTLLLSRVLRLISDKNEFLSMNNFIDGHLNFLRKKLSLAEPTNTNAKKIKDNKQNNLLSDMINKGKRD